MRFSRWFIAFLVLSVAFLYTQHRVDGILAFGFGNNQPLNPDTLHRYFDYSIGAPFVYRVLIPFVGNVIYHNSSLNGFQITFFLEFVASALVFYFLYLNILNRTNNERAAVASIPVAVSMLTFMCMLPRYIPFFYPYDTWGLAFVLILLYCFFTDKKWTFWILFVVGTLCRETTIFVPIFICFTALEKGLKRKDVFKGLAYALVWLATRTMIKIGFNSPGPSFQHQYPENIKFFITNFGYRNWAIWLLTIVSFGVALWFISFKKKNFELRPYFYLYLTFIAGMTYVGNLFEYRIYNELVPFILIPIMIYWNHPQTRTEKPF